MFGFERNINIVAECLWRLLEDGRIRFTSQDYGYLFGLPSPVDLAQEVSTRLTNASIDGITLREGTLDLSIRFSTGHVVEFIPDSSGYEAWNIGGNNQLIVAVPGGELSIFEDDRQ